MVSLLNWRLGEHYMFGYFAGTGNAIIGWKGTPTSKSSFMMITKF
jgi:hypothetical protein